MGRDGPQLETRMGHSAHAALMAEFRAGVMAASLYRELVLQDGPARAANPPSRPWPV